MRRILKDVRAIFIILAPACLGLRWAALPILPKTGSFLPDDFYTRTTNYAKALASPVERGFGRAPTLIYKWKRYLPQFNRRIPS